MLKNANNSTTSGQIKKFTSMTPLKIKVTIRMYSIHFLSNELSGTSSVPEISKNLNQMLPSDAGWNRGIRALFTSLLGYFSDFENSQKILT